MIILRFILVLISFTVIYSFFVRKTSKYGEAYLYSFSAISGLTYFSANILSIFRMYNQQGLFGYYIAMLIAGIGAHIWLNKKEIHFKGPVLSKDNYVRMIYTIAAIVLCLCVFRAMLYPPENNDSLTYHLVRAFYYFKSSKVTNIPSTYIIMNYSGPANAILLSHVFILTEGHEFGINLIQFPSMIAVGFAVRNICMELDISERSSVITGGVAMLQPLVILQSATTQNDLLAAGYAVLCCVFLIKSYRKMSFLDMACLGLCGGGMMLSKIASLSVILPFLIAYMVYGIRRKRLQAIKKYIISITASVFITCSFWFRNMVDLNGDFLAIGPSLYMNKGESYRFIDYIGKTIIYIVYCCCGYIRTINEAVLSVFRKFYHLIGAYEYGNWDSSYFVYPKPNHDYFPYGISLILALICIAIVLLTKGYKKVYKLYAFFAICSLIISALIMPGTGFVQSATRYMMGNAIICIPVIAFVMDRLPAKTRSVHWLKRLLMMGCMITMVVNGYLCNFYDIASPLKDVWKTSYEEKRDLLTPRSLSWALISDQIKYIIDENHGKRIGICEVRLTHIYSLLEKLKDEKYEVCSIYGEYGASYLDCSFTPDIIIWINEYGEYEEFLTYQGIEYTVLYGTDASLINNCQAVLYKKVSEQ